MEVVLTQELTGKIPLGDDETAEALRMANGSLHGELAYFKSLIAKDDRTARSWNVCKRMTNEYELICSEDQGGIPRVSPVSRSYFKMWEMLRQNVPSRVTRADRPLRMAFLAEAPGGFVESVLMFRKQQQQHEDAMHCITLVDPWDSHVPAWSNLITDCEAVIVRHAGADGTGDLYRIANIDHFVSAVGGAGSCDLVTADGGFDVSSDYNRQELLTLRLILCEAYTMLRVQRRGGAGVLKVFDVSHADTQRILRVLGSAYESVTLVKPLSSRPANSEKYVVCDGFRGVAEATLQGMREAIVRGAVAAIYGNGAGDRWTLSAIPVYDSGSEERYFLKRILAFNSVYVSRQIEYIKRTLTLIHKTSANARDSIRSTMITREYHRSATRRKQVHHAVMWCTLHGVPFGYG
jgi:23S rRNA U2552 (ribose-2'-O)-methylase RlmE/FtsJ